jgi:hypothetical protein
MFAVLHALVMLAADMFKSQLSFELKTCLSITNLTSLRRAPPRLRLRDSDRALLVWITRIWPSLLDLTQVGEASAHPAMASRWLESILAQKFSKAGRVAKDRSWSA